MAAAGDEGPGRMQEVGPLLEAAAGELGPEELVAVEGFTLLEAMGAVEVGHARMDSGLGRRWESPADLIAAGRAPLAGIGPGAAAGCADAALQLLAEWLEGGHMLSQTVFTNLYLHYPPEELDSRHPALGVFFGGLRTFCCETSRAVGLAGCFCEEDFCTQARELNLDGQCSVSASTRLREVAESLWQAALSREKAGAGDSKAGGEDRGGLRPLEAELGFPTTGEDSSADALRALECRLRLLQCLVDVVNCVDGHPRTSQRLDKCRERARQGLGFLKQARRTRGAVTTSGREIDRKVTWKALPPTPLREVRELGFEEGMDVLQRLLENVSRFPMLVSDVGVGDVNLADEALEAVMSYAAIRPGCFEASVLHLFLSSGDGPLSTRNLQNMVGRSVGVEASILRAVPPGLPGFDFLQKVCDVLRQIFRLLCHNRGRQRRYLCRVIDLLQGVQIAGEELERSVPVREHCEESLHAFPHKPLSSWLEHLAATCMLLHLMLGFELDLYDSTELCMVYWYCDYLMTVQIAYRHQRIGFLTKQELGVGDGRGGIDTRQTRGLRKALKRFAAEAAVIKMGIMVQEAQRLVCQGLARTLTALSMEGKIEEGSRSLSSEEERFEQRFATFFLLSAPEPVTYEHYRTATDVTNFSARDLYELAGNCFKEGQRVMAHLLGEEEDWEHWDEDIPVLKKLREQVPTLNKAATANFLATQLALTGKCDRLRCKFRYESMDNSHFAVLSLHS